MGSLSNYSKNRIAESFGNSGVVGPATFHFALYTVSPTVAGGGTEVSGNGYVRKSMTNNGTNFSKSATGLFTNLVPITFTPASGGAWGTIVAVGVFDAATGGNFLGFHTLDESKPISNTDQFNIAIGNFDVQF